MSAGSTLAAQLVTKLSADELRLLARNHQDDGFVDGFLCGRFGREHSRVALYNAALCLEPHLRRTYARMEQAWRAQEGAPA